MYTPIKVSWWNPELGSLAIEENTIIQISDEVRGPESPAIHIDGSSMNNVESNYIEGFEIGIHLEFGQENHVLNNTITKIASEGIFIQSHHNVIKNNNISDTGNEGIYVKHGGSRKFRRATENSIEGNVIYNTAKHTGDDAKRFIGARVYGGHNKVFKNDVSVEYGRKCMFIAEGRNNEGWDNRCYDKISVHENGFE